MRHILAAIALVCVCPAALADGGTIVTTDTDAYVVAPGELILGTHVQDAKWSPDGRFVLLKQMTMPITAAMIDAATKGAPPAAPPPGELNLILWDVRARKAQRVWWAPADRGPNVEYDWLAGSGIALASVSLRVPPAEGGPPGATTCRRGVVRIDGPNGRCRFVVESATEGFDSVQYSPFEPRAIVMQVSVAPVGSNAVTGLKRWSLIEQNGVVKTLCDGEAAGPIASITWSPTGQIVARKVTPPADGKGKTAVEWLSLDPRTGRTARTEAPKFAPPVARTPLLAVTKSSETVRRGDTKASVSLLWLEAAATGEQPRALLCADGDWGQLSPRNDAVLWSARGAAWIAPVVKISLGQFREVRDQARRTTLMSNGKQIALATIMYAQDNHEILPGPDGLADKLMPYCKNSAIFEGLVYTFAGGHMSEVQTPAETVMGYIPGPGGRAEIYVDGHVAWKKD